MADQLSDKSCIRSVTFAGETLWPPGCRSNRGRLDGGRVLLPPTAEFFLKHTLNQTLGSRTLLFEITLPNESDGKLLEVKLQVVGPDSSFDHRIVLGDPYDRCWSFCKADGHPIQVTGEETGWVERKALRLILNASQKTVSLRQGAQVLGSPIAIDRVLGISEGSTIQIVFCNHSQEEIKIHSLGLWSSASVGGEIVSRYRVEFPDSRSLPEIQAGTSGLALSLRLEGHALTHERIQISVNAGAVTLLLALPGVQSISSISVEVGSVIFRCTITATEAKLFERIAPAIFATVLDTPQDKAWFSLDHVRSWKPAQLHPSPPDAAAAAEAASPSPDSSQPSISTDWPYDVFISHAKTSKQFAVELENDLHSLGFKAFVNASPLHPEDDADMRLAESATRAPIGLVLFNRDFVERKWLMPGLKLIVEEGTLIPVVIGMSYPELEEAWRASNVAASQFDEALLKKIGRNTFVVDDWGWEHKRLRERICCAVLRIFVEEVCPRLPDAVSSMRYVMRALSAAQRIAAHELAYLKGADYDEAAHWVRHLQNIRDGHSPFDAPLPVFSG